MNAKSHTWEGRALGMIQIEDLTDGGIPALNLTEPPLLWYCLSVPEMAFVLKRKDIR